MKNIVLIASLLLLLGCNGGTNDSKLKNYPENIEFGSQGGTEQFTICIPEGCELITPKDCTWVEIDYIQEAAANGDSRAWITLLISENNTQSPRETTVTIRPKEFINIGNIIKGKGGLPKKIKIKQEGVMIENICDLNMRMIFVKGGTFTFGTPGSNEEHLVTLDSYYIGETEVTQAQWRAIMGSNPSEFVGDCHPVDHISWADALAFCQRLSQLTGKRYTLPTEAQWEYAARGGDMSNGCIYSGSNYINEVAKYGSSISGHLNVKSLKPNELGIYDMSGNVWEWCSDWYGSLGSSPETNPRGPYSGTKRVVRGGSWSRDAEGCTVTYRGVNSPQHRGSSYGLRVVCLP